jgi:hypothetical protein
LWKKKWLPCQKMCLFMNQSAECEKHFFVSSSDPLLYLCRFLQQPNNVVKDNLVKKMKAKEEKIKSIEVRNLGSFSSDCCSCLKLFYCVCREMRIIWREVLKKVKTTSEN